MPRILITGGSGQLGRASASLFEGQGWEVDARSHTDLDVTDATAVTAAIGESRPTAVLHAAAWTDVDGCEADPARADQANHVAVGHLSAACRQVGAHLCHISTDYVFDGRKRSPYTEQDPTNPQSVYGRSKRAGEVAAGPDATVIRTSWLAGRHGGNVVRTIVRLAQDPDRKLAFVDDQRGCPTVAEDLADAVVHLVTERRPGLFHVTNTGEATWYQLAQHVMARAGHDPGRVQPVSTAELDPPRPATRPAYSVLDNASALAAGVDPLPPWQDAVSELTGWFLDHA